MTAALATALLSGALTAAVPLLLAGLGEQMAEKSGVLNIGIEGMMLAGAYAGFVTAHHVGILWPGFAAGALAGMAVALPMVLLAVRLGLDQVVVGIALTLAVEGVTALLHHFAFGQSYPRLPLPGHSGPALLCLALALCAASAWLYRGTMLGLYLEAAGARPEGLDAVGVDVAAIRGVAVLATGALAGLAGAHLAEVSAGTFVPFMTGGSGFIAIVLAMLARGSPLRMLAGALLFGACLSAATATQVLGAAIPTDLVQMLPYLSVMAALLVSGRRNSLPASLGRSFLRGLR